MNRPIPPAQAERWRRQVQADLHGMTEWLGAATGLRSRWNGLVLLGRDTDAAGNPLYAGEKLPDCSIRTRVQRLRSPDRLGTALHEAIHAISVEGEDQVAYLAFHGFEEGVVERCTRMWLGGALGSIGYQGPFPPRAVYDGDITALEALRLRAAMEEEPFYVGLLRTPLNRRRTTVVEWVWRAETALTWQEVERELETTLEELGP